MRCLAFTAFKRGSLQGFADLMLDSGIVLLGCTYHQLSGKTWCSPPSRPQLDRERRLIVRDDGKIAYAPVIEFVDAKTRHRWSDEAVKAVEAAHTECKAPAEAGAMKTGGNATQPTRPEAWDG